MSQITLIETTLGSFEKEVGGRQCVSRTHPLIAVGYPAFYNLLIDSGECSRNIGGSLQCESRGLR